PHRTEAVKLSLYDRAWSMRSQKANERAYAACVVGIQPQTADGHARLFLKGSDSVLQVFQFTQPCFYLALHEGIHVGVGFLNGLLNGLLHCCLRRMHGLK